jgi:hypothetical protein
MLYIISLPAKVHSRGSIAGRPKRFDHQFRRGGCLPLPRLRDRNAKEDGLQDGESRRTTNNKYWMIAFAGIELEIKWSSSMPSVRTITEH